MRCFLFLIQYFQATYCNFVQGSSACQLIFVLLLWLSMVFTFHISSTISNLINWLLDIKWNLSVSLKLKSWAIWGFMFLFHISKKKYRFGRCNNCQRISHTYTSFNMLKFYFKLNKRNFSPLNYSTQIS